MQRGKTIALRIEVRTLATAPEGSPLGLLATAMRLSRIPLRTTRSAKKRSEAVLGVSPMSHRFKKRPKGYRFAYWRGSPA